MTTTDRPRRHRLISRTVSVAALAVLGSDRAAWATTPEQESAYTCARWPATIVGTAGDDVIYGTDERDVIYAGGGDDHVFGFQGSDLICLGAGNDNGSGGLHDDTILMGSGNDVVTGNEGDDYVSFEDSPAPVVADLRSGFAFGEGTGTDEVFNIERLTGSFHNDFLAGDDGANIVWALDGDDHVVTGGSGNPDIPTEAYDVVFAGGGDDLLEGGVGIDALLGEAGTDTFVAGDGDALAGGWCLPIPGQCNESERDTADLVAGSATGEGSDTLSYIERLTGTPHADTLRGNDGANRISGLGGADLIEGLAGDDTLHGGGGGDRLDGHAGADTVFGQGGDDRVFGWAGADHLDGGSARDECRGGADPDTRANCEVVVSIP